MPWLHHIWLISHASIQNSTIIQGVTPSEISETKNNTTMGYLYHILSFYGFWTFWFSTDALSPRYSISIPIELFWWGLLNWKSFWSKVHFSEKRYSPWLRQFYTLWRCKMMKCTELKNALLTKFNLHELNSIWRNWRIQFDEFNLTNSIWRIQFRM